MSELLQSGHHPDADQLNAFVEHTLPPHEQQLTLAHLAICADCRAIVSLSLLPVEQSPAVQPEPVRKPWFSGWNLAWPAAAALAGLVIILYVRNAATTRSSTAGNQVAISQSHASLPVPEASTIPALTSSPLSSEQRQSIPYPRAAIGAAKVPNSLKTDDVTNTQSTATLPIHGRNFADLQKGQPAPPTGGIHGSLGTSINGSAAGISAGAGSALPQAAAGNTLDQLQQNAFRAATKPSAQSATLAPATPAAAPTTLKQSQMAAVPPPPAPPPPATAATTVDVSQDNKTIEVTDAHLGAMVSTMNSRLVFDQSMSILAQHPLPSRLPALSVASTNHHTLAIDTQNTLFFSDDDGRHWKAIPSQWRGRAVKVDVAASTAASERNSAIATSKAQPASDFAAIGGPVLSSARERNSTLAGTVVDASGAVIPGASVVVSDATTPVVRSVTTDGTGRYRVDDLVPGSYQVAAEAPGFNKQQLAVTLTASQQGLTNITLSVGQSAQNVTVNASTMPVENLSLARKKISELQSAASQSPRFEITTDTGEHWTSTDGQNWKRK